MTSAFYRNSEGRRIFKCALCAVILLLAALLPPPGAQGRSAFSPRRSGLEPPGGPRQMENIPSRSFGHTPMGGRGYIDAYGNSLDDQGPSEKKIIRRRLEPRGHYAEEKPPPPEPPARSAPLWKF